MAPGAGISGSITISVNVSIKFTVSMACLISSSVEADLDANIDENIISSGNNLVTLTVIGLLCMVWGGTAAGMTC